VRRARAIPLGLVLLLAACGDARPPGITGDSGVLDPSDVALDAPSPADAAAGTTPYPAADFTVELPYGAPEQQLGLTVTALPGRVDVHLCIDTTGSFGGEIHELQSALETTVIPGLRAQIPSLSLGVSRFEDMPVQPFGDATDLPFELLLPQTTQTYLAAPASRGSTSRWATAAIRPRRGSRRSTRSARARGSCSARACSCPLTPAAAATPAGWASGRARRARSSW
jgi:hypothetical protein